MAQNVCLETYKKVNEHLKPFKKSTLKPTIAKLSNQFAFPILSESHQNHGYLEIGIATITLACGKNSKQCIQTN